MRTVSFPRKLRNDFSSQARLVFPAETFAVCLGTPGPSGSYSISALYYPPIKLDKDGRGFQVPPSIWALAARLASASRLSLVATLHSHPYPEEHQADDASPSETDLDYLCEELPMGICSIVEDGEELTCRYRFWPKIPKVKITQ